MTLPRVFCPGRRVGLCLAVLLLLCLPGAPRARAGLGLNSPGISDVWAMLYPAAAAAPNADFDGDGQSNAREAAAGTNPYKADSVIQIGSLSLDVDGVHLTFSTVLGKRYQVQAADTLAGALWNNVAGAVVNGTSSDVTLIVPQNSGAFYRVLVSDLDSDNDGVSDWEELAVGFDPHNKFSNGLSAADDQATISKALNPATRNVLSVVATTPLAMENTSDVGTFTITRRGRLDAVTAKYTTLGSSAVSGLDYVTLSGTVNFPIGVNKATVNVVPLADNVVESNEAVILTLLNDPAYDVAAPATAAVIIADEVKVNGTGLRAEFFNEATSGVTAPSTTNPPLMTNRVLTRTDATVNFNYVTAAWPGTPVTATYFASRWSGEVLPEFSQIYTFYTNVNAGGRLWVNGQLLINNWPRTGYATVSTEYTGTLELQAGVRYAIVFEHYEVTGNNAIAQLSWASANQPKQIIPQIRLFGNVPPQILSATDVTLLKDSGSFTYTISASGVPTSYTATNLPSGWSLSGNVITGTPNTAGFWEIPLTATNAYGSGTAVLELTISATGGMITREVWSGIGGSTVASIPTSSPPLKHRLPHGS